MNINESLDFKEITSKISEFIKTEYGSAELASFSPLVLEEAQKRMNMIKEIMDFRIGFERIAVSEIENIDKAVARISKGSEVGLEDIFQIRRAVIASEILRRQISSHKESLPQISSDADLYFSDISSVKDYLYSVLTDSGELVVEKFPALRRLQHEIDSLKKQILSQLSRIMNSPAYDKHLQEKVHDTRSGRFVILLKSSSRGAMQGSIHDVSNSMQTVYFEPDEIREHNSLYASRQFEYGIEISKAVAEIAQKICDNAEEIRSNAHVYGKIDFLNSLAVFSEIIKAEKPLISDENEIILYSARHPLLYLMNKDGVVANDIILDNTNCGMVISGANAGGKTVVLKTAGLCALMVRHGLLIPASPDSKISFFDNIYADIGDDQSISMSLSTYSGQIKNLTDMINSPAGKTLILVDEIISGTNPHYGAALARSVLEEFANKNFKFIVTTHYPELKKMASEDSRFMNASVLFDPESLKPTFILKRNLPGMSYTFEIADLMKMPGHIISRAKEVAGSDDLNADALLEKLHRYETELAAERDAVAEIRKELLEKISANEELEAKLKQAVREAKEAKGIEFIEELKTAHERIQNRIRELNQLTLKDAEKIRDEIVSEKKKTEESILDIRKDFFEDKYEKFSPEKCLNGSTVFVIPLEAEGIVESIDVKNKKINVIFGNSIRSKYSFKDVFAVKGRSEPRQSFQARPVSIEPSDIPLTIQTSYNTVDLRGMRVDEALSKLDSDLDSMMAKSIKTAVVIHGHGTGALKEAVRSHLKFSYYVLSSRSGQQGEGGDGVTIAALK